MKVFEDLGYVESKNVVRVILSLTQEKDFNDFRIQTTVEGVLCAVEVSKEDGGLHIEIKEIAHENV